MTIRHHPDDATLMSFAAGALPEALSAVVSAHLVSCQGCRMKVREMDMLGAVLMASLDEHARPKDDRVTQFAIAAPELELGALHGSDDVPHDNEPLDVVEGICGTALADIKWKRLGFGVWHYPIELSGEASGDLRLIKVQSGQAMPDHGHGGSELTLVLAGCYHDEIGTFAAGDVADLDDTVEHRPIADKDVGCICLIASEKKVRFKGVIGRLLQPFAGL